jgi:hypothetical protein
MKGTMGNSKANDDSAKESPTNLEEVRKGSRKRVINTRLDGYITSM